MTEGERDMRGQVMMHLSGEAHEASLKHLTGKNLNIMEIFYGLIDTADREELQYVLYPALIKACAFSEEFNQKMREAFNREAEESLKE